MISKTSSKQWLIIAMLLLGLMSIESLAIHYGYALENPGTADFFARWYGAKELVLHGRNPYHHDIELEAQEILFGRHTRSDEDQVNFAYPLYTIFIFLPLTLLSYAWAQAIWMTVLQFAMLGSALVLFDVIRWHPPIWLRISTLLWTIVFYSGTRAIMLGQFSVIVALCVFISIWGIMHGKDYLAGAILPLATIKPQMVFLLIPFFILWTFRQKRWNFLISFTVSTAVLMIASLIWLPDWLFSFLGNLSAYSGYVGFGSPLENMTAYFFPTIDVFLNPLITISLSLFLLWQWWLTMTKRPQDFLWALNWTLLISNLIAFRSATANHVILYLSLFLIFKRWAHHQWLIVSIQIFSSIALWTLFLTTIDTSRGSNFEAIFMHGFLPSVLIIYFFLDRKVYAPIPPCGRNGVSNRLLFHVKASFDPPIYLVKK